MSLTNDQITAKNFQKFYEEIRPYLNGGNHELTDEELEEIMSNFASPIPRSSSERGYIPCGKVEAFYREEAPEGYLICDGTEYAKADYPQLSALLLSLTNHTQYEGSDSNHFKVPDLRGEFLRGSGTNSHTNQGSGTDVGIHQDATTFMQQAFDEGNKSFLSYVVNGKATTLDGTDSRVPSSDVTAIGYQLSNAIKYETTSRRLTARPTNTSVLYCIAYKDIFLKPLSFYSTEEQIVGYWINNKPLYQKTIETTSPAAEGEFDLLDNLDEVIEIEGRVTHSTGWQHFINSYQSSSIHVFIDFNVQTKKFYFIGPQLYSRPMVITIRYTKITD